MVSIGLLLMFSVALVRSLTVVVDRPLIQIFVALQPLRRGVAEERKQALPGEGERLASRWEEAVVELALRGW